MLLNYDPEEENMDKDKKKKKQKVSKELYEVASGYIKRYSHSSRELYKAIIAALPPLKQGDICNPEAISLAIKAGEIMDLLAEASRTWSISIHWLYTVCNPRIEFKSSPKYSPIYKEYATRLPLNRFGELDHLIEEPNGSYVRIGDKLVGDSRFVGKGCEDFGASWNQDGEVIKRDDNDHPILDGFTGWVAKHVDDLQQLCCRNPHRDRHFATFLIAHARDDEVNKRDGEVEHKESHVHVVVDMPTRRTRYRMMELMGYNFSDLTATFKWIKTMDRKKERIEAFLGTLQGSMKNYEITKHYISSLQYLVHQSAKAKRDQKTPYAISEVISWLPDDPGKDYSKIAGVYDDEMVADGLYAEIIRNLHSSFNLAHHTMRLVGRNEGTKVFTYGQLLDLRGLGSKGPGKMTFSKRSKKMILDQLMQWIYQGKMEVGDWKNAIHGAFSDGDAADLIADQNFVKTLGARLDDQRKATISDIDADRKMTTIFITAAQGGIGKSYLANRLCQYYEKGRTPYTTAAEDKNKTVDYWQDYEDQASAVIDEVSPSSIEWSALKDMLDPHKIPRVSSRYHNVTPWNLNLLILTNVYRDGVAGYIREALHYAPGVTKLGYLKQDENDKRNWKMKVKDPQAGQTYLSQLSQLLRRLPVNIHLSPTQDGKGTKVLISIIDFRPGGRAIQDYDYVYTKNSVHTFRAVINEDIPESELDKIVVTVAKMLRDLKEKAHQVFVNDPNAILDEKNGFLKQRCNLGFYVQDGQPFLFADDKDDTKHEPIEVTVSRSVDENLLTKLSHLRYDLWPEIAVATTDFAPDEDQVTALLQGKAVPIKREKGHWVTLKLSPKALKMVQRHQVMPIIMYLNRVKSLEQGNDLFLLGQSTQVARLLPSSDQNGVQ